MSYQAALNSRNVLAPIALEDAAGRRYNAARNFECREQSNYKGQRNNNVGYK